MANPLPTLKKLTQRQLEELQLKIAAVQRKIDSLQQQQANLSSAVDSGFQTAIQVGQSDMLYAQAGHFSDRTKDEIPKLKAMEQEFEEQLDDLQDQLRTLFAERERYNILMERERVKAARAAAKSQQRQLDELAGQKRS